MAKRRRAARAKTNPATEPEPSNTVHDGDAAVDADGDESGSDTPETCPGCESAKSQPVGDQDRTWVLCEPCEKWYHASCVGLARKLDTVDKWYCSDCIAKDPSRVITFKTPARKSARNTNKVDYANLNAGIAGDPRRWFRHLNQKPMKKSQFKRMKGSEVTMDWLRNDEAAMTEPFVVESPEGLGMKMPAPSFTVSDVAKVVGPREKVDVLDVASQREDKGWTLQSWAEYYNTPAAEREKIRNVISLEISETKLAEKIMPPRLVRELDWVEQAWPASKRKGAGTYPKVQMYCLMSVAECWTDWHLDFAGTSVYYHILKGSKIFYFIRPTAANLAAYERWSGSETNQASVWLGDWVDEVVKVELVERNTMIIPTGWIHCVYTPKDSLVFGGNFLHSWNVATQLRVRDLEIATKVPKKFRFPYFRKLCWYVAEKMLKDLKSKEEFSSRVLSGFDALAGFLIKESRIMERTTTSETARKDSKEQVPANIKDPAALARELRWRVRLAAGADSGDELESPFPNKLNGLVTNGKRSSATPVGTTAGVKRKRGSVEERTQGPRFKGFIPRQWNDISLRKIEDDNKDTVDIPALPTNEDGIEWMENVGRGEVGDSMDGDGKPAQKANRSRFTDEIVKVRRTLGKDETVVTLERETIRRVYETWSFHDEDGETKDARTPEDAKPVDSDAAGKPEPDTMDTTADILDPPPDDNGLIDTPLDSTALRPSSMDHESVEEMLVDAGFISTAPPVAV